MALPTASKKRLRMNYDIVGQTALDQLGRGADVDKQDCRKALRSGLGCVEPVRLAQGYFGRQQRPDADIGHRFELARQPDRAIRAERGQHPGFGG